MPQPAIWSRFSPDGRYLAARLMSGEVMAWDLVESKLVWTNRGFLYLGVDGALDFSPDSKMLATVVRRGVVSVLRCRDGNEVQTFACDGRVHGLRFDPGGTRLAASEGNALCVWNLSSDRLQQRFEFDPVGFAKLHWHPSGQLIAGAGTDGLVYLVPLEGGKVRKLPGHTKPVIHVAFNRAGDRLVSDSFDGTTRLWDVAKGETLLSTSTAFGNYFSPDDQTLGYARVQTGIGKWRIIRGLEPRWEPTGAATVATNQEGSLNTLELRDERLGIALSAAARNSLVVRALADGRALASIDLPDGVTASALASSDTSDLLIEMTNGRHLRWLFSALSAELDRLGAGWRAGDAGAQVAGPPSPLGPGGMAAAAQWTSGVFPAATLGALLIACAAAALVWWRHRGLVRELIDSENIVAEQHERLDLAHRSVAHSQKMQALGTLAAGVAHDFNNLLSVIRMSGKIIGRENPTHPAVQENVAAIEKAVLQGRSVVSALLGYSREHPDPPAPYSVIEAVEDTVALLSRKYLESITLTLELDKSVPPVVGAKRRFEQALLNLIVNAVEAMSSHGDLLFRVGRLTPPLAPGVLAPRPAQEYVEVVIQDSGPGIPEPIRDRVFEPFFTTKHAGATPGTGLGLSTVYMLAQQDGWGLDLVSAPGKGAAFRIILPGNSPVES